MDNYSSLQELADLFGLEDSEMEDLLTDAGIDIEDLWF